MPQSPGASFDFVIVPAGPADAEALARVHVQSWRETYRGLLPDAFLARMSEPGYVRRFRRELTFPRANDVVLVAANPYGVFGYAAGGPSRRRVEGEAEIATLYILRAGQGRGVGKRLVIDTARSLAAQGARSLRISVLRDNVKACAFYQHLGGQADEPRETPGPGGGMVFEVDYRWPEIGTLVRG